MRILLIEDDAGAASYILKGLNKLGDVGDHVVDGRDGLIQATTGNYDVIVVDRMLPGLEGLAKLVVAKLDRLSRNVSFLLTLIDSGVEVLFADLPELNGAMGRFMLTTMASVAELEAGLISERTKAALKAAKARGVRLGRHGAEVLAPQYRVEAHQRAQELQPIIAELKNKGLSLAKMAGELNKRKVATPRGGRWDHSSVRNVLKRIAA